MRLISEEIRKIFDQFILDMDLDKNYLEYLTLEGMGSILKKDKSIFGLQIIIFLKL